MLKYCDSSRCVHDLCKRRTKKVFCKTHINFIITYIPYYRYIDPFDLESRIITFQNYWRNPFG